MFRRERKHTYPSASHKSHTTSHTPNGGKAAYFYGQAPFRPFLNARIVTLTAVAWCCAYTRVAWIVIPERGDGVGHPHHLSVSPRRTDI